MKNLFSFVFFLCLSAYTQAQVTANVSVSNIVIKGTNVEMDFYLSATGGSIYLADTDFRVLFNEANFTAPTFTEVAGFTELSIFYAPDPVIVGSNQLTINVPNVTPSVSTFATRVGQIGSTPVRIGRYRLSGLINPAGSLGLTCSTMTINSFNPADLKANPVGLTPTTGCVISSNVVLPLDLLSFDAKTQGNNTHLSWKTTNEKNVNYYEVEKSSSANINGFTTLEKIAARNKDTESYDLTDDKPFPSVNYYRLKMVNIDGSVTYSSIKTVVFKDAKKTVFKVFPNPAFNSLTIDYALDLQTNLTDYAVVNMLGQTLMQGKLTSRDLDISSLPTGAFVIKVGEGQTKFFKQ
jgi:Secretion system C-terminal sorting domain